MTPALEARSTLRDAVEQAIHAVSEVAYIAWLELRVDSRAYFRVLAEAAVTATIGQTGEVCPKCEGRGWIAVSTPNDVTEWGTTTTRTHPCPDCGGTGRAPDRPPTRMPCAEKSGHCLCGSLWGNPNAPRMDIVCPVCDAGEPRCSACLGSGVGELAVLAALGMEQTGWLWTQEGSTEWRQWTLTEPSGHAISKMPVYAARAVKEEQ